MDTSETYIKMCEKAEEIQKLWNSGTAKDGDCYFLKPHAHSVGFWRGGTDIFCWGCVGEYSCHQNWELQVWLPRQDQLQEMVECWSYGIKWKKESDNLIKLERFYQFVNEGNEGIGCLFSKDISFEKFWLAFVMKEKHSKVWSGEDWSSQS